MMDAPKASRSSKAGIARWPQIYRAFSPFGRLHRANLVAGAISALFVVGIRLALPWPLRAMMRPWLKESGGAIEGPIAALPTWLSPAVAIGGLFLVLILCLGYADFRERLFFAKFAIGATRDLRAEAFRRIKKLGARSRALGSGDLVARLIGDTARLKTGLKGFLVHVATNGVMLLGVTVVLLYVDVALGLVFVGAGASICFVTILGARQMYHRALKFRTKEGRLADYIHEASGAHQVNGSFGDVNRSSGRHEAALTRVQGVTTLAAHIILGTSVLLALCLGAHAVSTNRMAAGDLLVVMMYAVMMRAPIVQLARQGARTGKILACGDRLERLLSAVPQLPAADVAPLGRELHLEHVTLTARRAGRRVRTLGPIDLRIPAGQHIAVLGKAGSGKTALLESLANPQAAAGGSICWDGLNLCGTDAVAPASEIALVPHNPMWPRRSLGEMLNCANGAIDDETMATLRKCGANSLLKRLPGGVDTKLGSSDLSSRERVALALAALVRGSASLWLLDDPVAGLEKRKARKIIKQILNARPEATVIATLSRPVRLARFDRVIVLQRGRIVFDGTPIQWHTASAVPDAKPDGAGETWTPIVGTNKGGEQS